MLKYNQGGVSPWESAYDVTKVEVLDEKSPSTSMRLAYVSNVRIPLAKLLNSIEKTYDKKNYFLPDSRKNTAFTGNTGQSGSDVSSGGLVRSALNIPTDTQGVPFDNAKVRKITQSTKNNIIKYNNRDAKIKVVGDIQKDAKKRHS